MSGFDYTTFQHIQLRSERDIMAGWKGDPTRPLVSVVCTAFNQAPYIDDAIKGFLIQETTFPFEVIIHDDASTDGTAAKIRAFEQRYPRILKCVYQTANQYSKGRRPLLHTFHLSCGEYIAICEGDDFWISPTKLQRQYEGMVAHPAINICLHTAYAESHDGERTYTSYGFAADAVTVLSAAQVIEGGGGFCATASLMISAAFAKRLPSWIAQAPVLDLFIQGLGAAEAGALYVPEIMCVYRLGTVGSWTRRLAAAYISSAWLQSYELALNNFDKDTADLYHMDIARQAAVVYYKGAKSSLRYGRRTDFLERIAKSLQYDPHLSSPQQTLHRWRWSFPALSLLYRFYKRWLVLSHRGQ